MRILIALLLALTGIALCQSATRKLSSAQPLPTVDRIIQRNIEVLGGRDALTSEP